MAKRKKAKPQSQTVKLDNWSFRLSQLFTIDRIFIGGAILAAVAILAYFALKPDSSPPGVDPNIPDNSVAYDIQSRDHIENGASHPAYNSNPPTSGWHYASPADWGIYTQVIPDETAIHNLEHGGVWISYNNEVDDATIKQLDDIAGQYPTHVILTPRPDDDSPIAVAAWGRLLKLDTVDSGQINNFIARYRFQGPEDVP